MNRYMILNMILFGFLGFFLSFSGFDFRTLEFYVIMAITILIQINGAFTE